jgi:hypothetical protein
LLHLADSSHFRIPITSTECLLPFKRVVVCDSSSTLRLIFSFFTRASSYFDGRFLPSRRGHLRCPWRLENLRHSPLRLIASQFSSLVASLSIPEFSLPGVRVPYLRVFVYCCISLCFAIKMLQSVLNPIAYIYSIYYKVQY